MIEKLKGNMRAIITKAKNQSKITDFNNDQLVTFEDLNVEVLTEIADATDTAQGAIGFVEFLVALLIVFTVIGLNAAAWFDITVLWKVGVGMNILFIAHMLLISVLGFHLSKIWKETWDLRGHSMIDYFKKYLDSCKSASDKKSDSLEQIITPLSKK
jgi:uncharacterized membrane protein YagU involved in acid resistance